MLGAIVGAWISFIAPSLPQMGKAPRWTSEIPLVFPWCCMKCRCGHVWRDDSQNFADSHGSTLHWRSYSQEPDVICLCISPRKYGTLVVVALLETLSLLQIEVVHPFWFSKGATILIEVWMAWPPIGSLSNLWGQFMVLCQKSNFVNRCRHLF